MENKKKNYIVLIIGIVILILSIIMLVKGISQYSQAKLDYDVAYSQWRDAWFNNNASMSDAPNFPSVPAIMIIGPFGIVIGLALTGLGAAIAFGKETADLLAENAEKTTNIFDSIKDIGKPKNRICKYCGCENKPDATKCTSCGAGLSEKRIIKKKKKELF